MAKKVTNSKELNYRIERIRQPLSRKELDKIASELKSDDDFINYHIPLVEETNNRYMITIMNDDYKSPKINSTEERSYGFMRVNEASEFLNNYIDEGKANSKPKEVMRNGYSKKSIDKYNELVKQEQEETSAVNQFTEPTFNDMINGIYVNVYNGETYSIKDESIPDDLREDVGVTIPGVIENREDYFEFVKRLKDRGRGGLGRTIYERYEDYEEAVDLITQYKQALFDKYGGKEEFFAAKELGGMFGAHEYYPTVKPRFKKTLRNIKLDKGINLNELASVKDMGSRIRAEYDDEINRLEIDNEVIEFEITPPKFRDLPEELQMVYKNDKNGHNSLDRIRKFKKLEQYANECIRSKDESKIDEGYRLLEEIRQDRYAELPMYDSEFIDIGSIDELPLYEAIAQMDYDKLLYETNYDTSYVDIYYNEKTSEKAFNEYMKEFVADINDLDISNPEDKTTIIDMAEYATKYMFNLRFRQIEDDKQKVNSAGEVLYRENKEIGFGKESDRSNSRSKESKIHKYIREISDSAKASLERLMSNADTTDYNTPTMNVNDITSYDKSIDTSVDGFDLPATSKAILKYVLSNELLAKKIYELSSDKDDEGMFNHRTGINDFVDKAGETTKPFMTESMIDTMLQSSKRGVKLDEKKKR